MDAAEQPMYVHKSTSEANDNQQRQHPTSRGKAINRTKEQPRTQFSSFPIRTFSHLSEKGKWWEREYIVDVTCRERESPLFASECSCGFWRVDQRVFISTQVHIWRQKEKPSKRKKLLGLVLKLWPPADGCNYFGLHITPQQLIVKRNCTFFFSNEILPHTKWV